MRADKPVHIIPFRVIFFPGQVTKVAFAVYIVAFIFMQGKGEFFGEMLHELFPAALGHAVKEKPFRIFSHQFFHRRAEALSAERDLVKPLSPILPADNQRPVRNGVFRMVGALPDIQVAKAIFRAAIAVLADKGQHLLSVFQLHLFEFQHIV